MKFKIIIHSDIIFPFWKRGQGGLQLLLTAILIFVQAVSLCQVPATTTIHLADPTIFQYKNKFYLYGTVEQHAGNGFVTYVSDDLKNWTLFEKNEGYVLRQGESFGTSGFWAPQVFRYKQKFYMAYTANENIAIAESDHPTGPFRQAVIKPLEAPVKQIDPFVFIDDDGKKYLYHVRLTNGNRIFVAEMNDDFQSIKTETLKECISALAPWENTTNAKWPVSEGPTVLKLKGIYYLFYSANDFRNPDYAVGYATSSHPLGPWIKNDANPILTRELVHQNGPGHGDFLKFRKDFYYVFHAHKDSLKATPRRTAIIQARFTQNKSGTYKIAMDTSSFYFLPRITRINTN